MTTNRREFLKIVGASAFTLVTSSVVLPVQAKESMRIPGQDNVFPKAFTAKRWAMAIDATKCPPDCKDCIVACHAVHNVPNFGNRKDEIKWIWTEPFASVFPAEDHPYSGSALQKLRVPVLCNHCAQSAVRPGMSDEGDVQASRRHCHDGPITAASAAGCAWPAVPTAPGA